MLSNNKLMINRIKSDTKIDILGILENLSDDDMIPKNCGAYIITALSGKRYIGSSINIFRRIRQHRSYMYWRKNSIDTITIFLTWDGIDARMVEYWLISELDPEINKECVAKTVILRPDVYKAIINRKAELLEKNIEMNIQDLVSGAILAGIDLVGE